MAVGVHCLQKGASGNKDAQLSDEGLASAEMCWWITLRPVRPNVIWKFLGIEPST